MVGKTETVLMLAKLCYNIDMAQYWVPIMRIVIWYFFLLRDTWGLEVSNLAASEERGEGETGSGVKIIKDNPLLLTNFFTSCTLLLSFRNTYF